MRRSNIIFIVNNHNMANESYNLGFRTHQFVKENEFGGNPSKVLRLCISRLYQKFQRLGQYIELL